MSISVDVQPTAGRIGAVLTGIRAAPDLPDEMIGFIRQNLLRHKVLFLRGQDHLDDAAQTEFARRFGPLTAAHPTVPGLSGNDRIFDLDYSQGKQRANNWHTDVTFVLNPPSISVLRAVVVPPFGGDTVWANTAEAYSRLPESLRVLADSLRAVHTNAYDYAGTHPEVSEAALRFHREVFTSTQFRTEHPVARVHPETREKSLLLGGFAQQLRGLGGTESARLIETFQEHVTRLENTVRWRWSPGDLVLWDNRATQHYAIADYGDTPRHVRRVTVSGDVPVGVDGSRSESLAGDASGYSEVSLPGQR